MPSKHDCHWTFGDKCHIHFPGGGDPVVDSAHGFNAQEGCASISDSNGNLLFYTDGQVLYDANHLAIPSPPLGGTPASAHAAIIIPPAGGGSLYHIFTTPDWDGTNSPNVGPLTYTTVSVPGSVSIVSGPTKLTSFGPQRSAEGLAAVPHRDCGKYWVVSADTELPPAPPYDLRTLFGDEDAGDKAAAGATAAARDHEHLPDEIAERCRRMGLEVQWETLKPVYNLMRPCRGEIQIPFCRDVELPDLRPRVYVFWGDSKCDCIEGDDTEIMFVVVYNPYHNVTLCDVEINRIRVVDAAGNDVPNLPDGSASIQLVPRGKYCFGDLAPCSIAWRQFVLRLRGAPPGSYRILIEGICYELCLHRMTEECVTFDVCKD